MSGPFRENWKRLSDKVLPKGPTALENEDIVRVSDLGEVLSSAIATSGQQGDLVAVLGTSGTWEALSIGSNGQVLTVISGVPGWSDPVAATGGGGGGLTGTGDTIISGDLTVLGDTAISGNLVASGDSILNNVTVTGIFTFDSTIVYSVASGTGGTFNVGNEYFNGATSGVSTVVMPSSPIRGQAHIVKDLDGTAGTLTLVVDGNGNTIDGLASRNITTDYGSLTLVFGPTEWNII